ncbi:MAG: hypothetical protein CVT73_07820 [Alphaproteobacteria bacterium HGW-Alphaproteobacteria-12]|nr:MAG: hypothetical protein CVT73_07820 [Alphaproteobacteria bacterium HGW-Alphaproteobacteria-12]
MKGLHWTVAILVLIMFYGGFTLSKETATLHFGTGLVVLVAMAVWLAVRANTVRPPYPAAITHWHIMAAKLTHRGLYTCVTLQPLFGLLAVSTSKGEPTAYGVIPLKIVRNDTVHEIGEVLHGVNAWILVALVTFHVLGALYHRFITRDNVMQRMLPFGKA